MLSHKSPYEILHRQSLTYSHIHIFGCLCHATNLTPMHTFDMCAHRCIFVSYLIGQKEYRVYDLDTKKFFTSRDVFHEHIFPFSISPPKNQLDYPIVPIPLNDFTTSMPSAMVDSLDSPSSLSQVEPPSSMESSIPIESTKISSQHQSPPPFITLLNLPKPQLILENTKSTMPCCLTKVQSLLPRLIHGTVSIGCHLL